MVERRTETDRDRPTPHARTERESVRERGKKEAYAATYASTVDLQPHCQEGTPACPLSCFLIQTSLGSGLGLVKTGRYKLETGKTRKEKKRTG